LIELSSDIEYEPDTLFDGSSCNTTRCDTSSGPQRARGGCSDARARYRAEQS